jgi:hypothetical protein
VDFVISNGWYSRNQVLRNVSFPQQRKLVIGVKRREAKQDSGELRELMDLYSQWRKAA